MVRGRLIHAIAMSTAAAGPSIRLYTPHAQPLVAGAQVALTDGQRHHLFSVMRQREGGTVAVFNGADGEWEASIDVLSKRQGTLGVRSQLRVQPASMESPTLLFGVLKGARQPMLIEKAVELGAGELQPVISQHCAVRSLNVERLSAVAAEAAEQSGRLTVPCVRKPSQLKSLLDEWDTSRTLCVCDERRSGPPLSERLADGTVGMDAGLLIGPEGGFSAEEFEALEQRDFVCRVSLGPNILRAETAALAALAVLSCR